MYLTENLVEDCNYGIHVRIYIKKRTGGHTLWRNNKNY